MIVPLICFAKIEVHQADQVMQQFRFCQSIPTDPLNLNQMHKENMRGIIDPHWPQYHTS